MDFEERMRSADTLMGKEFFSDAEDVYIGIIRNMKCCGNCNASALTEESHNEYHRGNEDPPKWHRLCPNLFMRVPGGCCESWEFDGITFEERIK